jgi:NADH dehydrogenase/NADH:ubiquinone oxidoreductase subunit G
MPVTVTINGKAYEAEKGEYILAVARRNKILIPTMCHHESLSGQGCCRLCVVEVNEGSGPKVVVSCVYPVNRDCEVSTESEKIKRLRRSVLGMLRDRAPQGTRLASLCQIYQVPENERFTVPPNEKCVLCGLCVQACAGLGTGAIATVSRGIGKRVSTPYDESARDCVGCGSCAEVCPTGAIECTEDKGTRTIWNRSFELMRCEECGAYFATKEEFAYAAAKTGLAEGPHICEACRRKKSADVMAAAFGIRQ